MKRLLHRLAGLLVFLSLASAAVADNEIYYGVYQGSGALTPFGTNKAESYDVAIHLTDPTLVGLEIRALRFPLNTKAKNMNDYRVWLTKELTLASGKTVPDILSVEATPDGTWAEAVLSEPYVIEEGGLYAGYSLTVSSVESGSSDDPNMTPIMVTANKNPDGLLIHTSRTYRKWIGLADAGSSAMVVRIGGERVKQNAAMLQAPDNLFTVVGKSIPTTLTLVNHGSENIKNIEYEIEINGTVETKTLTKSLPGGYYGRQATFSATIPASSENGTFPTKFRVTKVNGEENEDPYAETVVPVTFVAELPVRKPLVEEYTGTWCQYCPRALAGMEKMSDSNGDNFVGVAYHELDEMEFTPSTYLPADPSGLPSVFIDRIASFDPLNGQGDWEKRKAIISPANISVVGEWANEAKTRIKATSSISFIRDFTNSPYRVGYILIANDLHSTEWKQSNAYSGSSSDDPYLNKYCKMSNPVRDLHYNEVALAQSAKNGAGIEESLPSMVMEFVPYQHSYEFDITGNGLPLDKGKLEVIAVLIDTRTGEVVNCNKGHVGDATGIEEIKNEESRMKNEVFDLAGRKVVTPKKGLYIQNGKKIIK